MHEQMKVDCLQSHRARLSSPLQMSQPCSHRLPGRYRHLHQSNTCTVGEASTARDPGLQRPPTPRAFYIRIHFVHTYEVQCVYACMYFVVPQSPDGASGYVSESSESWQRPQARECVQHLHVYMPYSICRAIANVGEEEWVPACQQMQRPLKRALDPAD